MSEIDLSIILMKIRKIKDSLHYIHEKKGFGGPAVPTIGYFGMIQTKARTQATRTENGRKIFFTAPSGDVDSLPYGIQIQANSVRSGRTEGGIACVQFYEQKR